MKIAVIGGGNIGTQFACVCASKGHEVSLYTSRPELWSENLEVHNDDGSTTHGKLFLASNNIAEVVKDRQIIFITHPAFMFDKTFSLISPHIKSGAYIGVIPGTGGAEFYFKRHINNAILFGLQRVPSVARVITPGKSVRASGKRDRLKLAAIPKNFSGEISNFMSKIFDMPCDVLKNYLCITLTPSNPILHTSRLRTMFKDYEPGKFYPRNFLFYGDWNDDASRLLFACDAELQELCAKISGLELSEVRSLREHYESDTPEALTRKIQSIKSLNNIHSPMKEISGGWVPDFQSRYFTADFPFGLAIIEDIAKLFGFFPANIIQLMNWYREITNDNSRFKLSDFGINDAKNFYAIYNQKGFDFLTMPQNYIITPPPRINDIKFAQKVHDISEEKAA